MKISRCEEEKIILVKDMESYLQFYSSKLTSLREKIVEMENLVTTESYVVSTTLNANEANVRKQTLYHITFAL